MTKGWHNESRRHALASKGIKTTTDPMQKYSGKVAINLKKPLFSPSDLRKIKKRTEDNAHIENYIFIAKKTGFSTEPFEQIKKNIERDGYNANPKDTYKLYSMLMKDLKKQNPIQYQQVYNRL